VYTSDYQRLLGGDLNFFDISSAIFNFWLYRTAALSYLCSHGVFVELPLPCKDHTWCNPPRVSRVYSHGKSIWLKRDLWPQILYGKIATSHTKAYPYTKRRQMSHRASTPVYWWWQVWPVRWVEKKDATITLQFTNVWSDTNRLEVELGKLVELGDVFNEQW
jgi:hypothetical protein